ncbi:hypothetical protein BvCmsKSP013_01991 [Escherichia coli]|nr:hypothetical protein BvCmsKSP013_01991 [Escherichia coli]
MILLLTALVVVAVLLILVLAVVEFAKNKAAFAAFIRCAVKPVLHVGEDVKDEGDIKPLCDG